MNFGELIEKFANVPPAQRVVLVGTMCGLLGAAFYFMFYADLAEKETKLNYKIATLNDEKQKYEDKKRRYMSFRAEVNKLLEEHKELVKVLPNDAEVPAFLQSIHGQAELADLNILTFDLRPEIQQGFYAKIPVYMAVTGSYHRINKFFYQVGRMKRIVNIEDVSFSAPTKGEKGIELRAIFTTSTFRFIESKKG